MQRETDINLKRWMSGQMDALCNGQKISLNLERLVTKIKCVCECVCVFHRLNGLQKGGQSKTGD